MPRVSWPLIHGRPALVIVLTLAQGGQALQRTLLADSGAGSQRSGFELLLDEDDCLLAGGAPDQPLALGGAYTGSFPVYRVRIQIPALGFDAFVRAAAVPSQPPGFDGLAGFRFLNRFTYGNFGDPSQFGLET